MKFFFSLVCSFILISNCALSQVLVSGRVIDKNRIPLSYCTIEFLLASDSSSIGSAFSDSLGIFSKELQFKAPFLLRVSLIGYKRGYFTTPNDSTQKIVNLNDLTLELDKNTLGQIVVSDKNKIIERKIDRIIFNTDNVISASGSDVLELLAKTPMVQVMGNSISVIGKGSVRVLFNDRLFNLSEEDLTNFLKSIPADNILRIEVITTPPAKYDASGGALINIVTKKNKLLGTNGSIMSSYTQAFYPSGQIGLNLNHRRNKINVYANATYRKGSTRPVEKTNQFYPARTIFQTEYTKQNTSSLNATAGLDYDINKNSTFGVLYSTTISKLHSTSNTNANYTGLDEFSDSLMLANNEYNRFANTQSVNLNYAGIIDSTGKKINIDADYVLYYNERDRNFNGLTYVIPSYALSSINNKYNTSKQQINIGTLKTDFEWPTKLINLNYGFKLSWINNQSNNNIYNNKLDKTLDTTQSNNFVFDEKTEALYISGDKTFKKLEVQLGIRFENTKLNGYSPSTTGKINSVDKLYRNIFPTIYFLYTFNEKHNLSLSLDRRIDRPEYSALNPFRYYQTPFIYSEGNPYLNPNYPQNADLSYTYKQRYVFGLIYTGLRNSYNQVPVQVDQQTLAYLQMNIGNTDQFGFYGMVPINVREFMENTIQVTYITSKYTTTLSNFSGITRNVFVCNLHSQLYWGKNKRYSGEISANMFPFGSVYTITTMGHQFVVNAGLKISLFKNKAYLRFSVNDIFRQNAPTGETISDNLRIKLINQYDTRNFRISFTYKFGYSGIKSKRERSTGNVDENDRLRK
jgi:hypothetical protein